MCVSILEKWNIRQNIDVYIYILRRLLNVTFIIAKYEKWKRKDVDILFALSRNIFIYVW